MQENCLIENCLTKHRIEKKNLQADIQKLKHSIPKGDKKKKKEVFAQIEILEQNLQTKHNQELALLQPLKEPEVLVDEICDKLDNTNQILNEKSEQRISKSQRKREKKALKQAELDNKVKLESEQCPKNNLIELEKLNSILNKRDLIIFEIASDGNCLYSAISHQLKQLSIECNISSLRKLASEYMLQKENDFIPFLINEETGEMLDHEKFVCYCDKVSSTSEWGGQAELRAISDVLEVCIEVLQADGPTVLIGEQFIKNRHICITYHRHEYGLGEHYNSVVLKTNESTIKQ